jgi:hypothetical protein
MVKRLGRLRVNLRWPGKRWMQKTQDTSVLPDLRFIRRPSVPDLFRTCPHTVFGQQIYADLFVCVD